MAEDTPKTLGRYEIQGEIGRGMMGVVYRALDPALGRTVALKTVRLAFSIPEDQRGNFEKRFLGEARIAAVLSHPGIVVVHDVGRDDTGTLFIALEFLEGRTLAEILADNEPIEWHRALRLVGKIAEALAHAHAQGIVHRDIKPANIMVLPSDEPKIMDFGIAKIPASQLTAAGEFFGTPSYMSPEQARGDTVDGRSDLFSLGAILYLLLTGIPAFAGNSVPAILLRLSSEDPPPPSTLVPGIPTEVDRLVARMLQKELTRRPPNGREVAQAIEALLSGRALPRGAETRTVSAVRAVSAAATSADRNWRRMALFAAPLALAGVGALAFWIYNRSGETPSPGSPPPPGPGLFGSLVAPFESPAHLEVGFEYPFKTGRLKLWIDDSPAFDEPLEGRLVRKVLSVRIHKGFFKKTLDLPPGEHTLKIQVDGDGDVQVRKVPGRFKSGATHHLEVTYGGLVRRELGLEWWS